MGHMGTDAAAANSIASVVRDLVCCMCNGLASGGGILVGNELGAGNLSTGREYGDRLIMMHQGNAIIDKAGEEKVKMKVDDILETFNRISIECGN